MTVLVESARDLVKRKKDLRISKLPAATRSLTNPDIKVELRSDFPAPIETSKLPELKSLLTKELLKHGINPAASRTRINVVHPHKHPVIFEGHRNGASEVRIEFMVAVKKALPEFEWVAADGICETVHLNRSGNQSVLNALAGRQVFEFHAPSQKDTFPFISQDQNQKEFFLIVDTCSEQGTTLTNLCSFLEHNGGHVLGAALSSNWLTGDLVQKRIPVDTITPLSKKFTARGRNNGRLADMAEKFSQSLEAHKGLEHTPQQCLDAFERLLNRVGNTVFALTDSECERASKQPFHMLIRGLQEAAEHYEALAKKDAKAIAAGKKPELRTSPGLYLA